MQIVKYLCTVSFSRILHRAEIEGEPDRGSSESELLGDEETLRDWERERARSISEESMSIGTIDLGTGR